MPLVAAMPRQEDPPAAKEQSEGGSQASMQAAPGGAQGESATSPGKENEDAAAAAAKQAAQDAVDATAATAKKAAEDMAAEAKRQKVEAAERKRNEEEAEAQAVRNETRIAMDDVMTVFDNVPRAGCPAPDVVKSAPWVAFVIPVQSYIRGRPNRAMPVSQTKYLQELEWMKSKDMILVGCGHDPSVVQAGQTKLRLFEAIKSFRWHPLVPVAQARSRTKHYVEYVLVGSGPDCPPIGAVPCFLQTRQGYPSVKLRPKHCDQPIPGGMTAGVGEQQGQICTIHTWARSRYLTHMPNPPRVLKKGELTMMTTCLACLVMTKTRRRQRMSRATQRAPLVHPQWGVIRSLGKMVQLFRQPRRNARSGMMLGVGGGP